MSGQVEETADAAGERALAETLDEMKDYQRDDVLRLIELYTMRDPRSLREIYEQDQSFSVVEVETASDDLDDNYQTISFQDGLTGGFRIPEGEKKVVVGDELKIWTRGPLFGGMRRGFAVNGRVYEYLTDWEIFVERMKMLADSDRRDREHADESRAAIVEWKTQLEGPFLARIERFEKNDPMFLIDGGTYETYPVLMAQRIAKHVAKENGLALDDDFSSGKDYDEVREMVDVFHKLDHDEQKGIIHAGVEDKYGISGHQFDMACALAAAVLAGREI